MVDAKPPKASPNSKGEDGKEQLEIKPDDPWEINLPFDEIPEHDMSVYYGDNGVHTSNRKSEDTNQPDHIYEVVQQIKTYQHVIRRPGAIRRRQLLTRISWEEKRKKWTNRRVKTENSSLDWV